MFTVLNRLRGTYGYFSHITGLVIGSLFYTFTQDIYTSIGLTVAYVAGESSGWGKWFGGIFYKDKTPQSVRDEDEGVNNGIHWLSNKIAPQDKDFYKYSVVALTLRGILWFGLTLLPLVIGNYIELIHYLAVTLLLGIGFPLSVHIGIETKKKWNFKFMNGWWEHSEVWYGLMQDIILLSILFQGLQ